ncbi:cyclin-like protein [Lipomyces japonicus]|uniref:cyclin-like protein n=1 Tax=Lipomyces japonicus TaxID=56871 RepID=UPI0034CEA041
MTWPYPPNVWLFTAEELVNTPSVREGISVQSETTLRAKGASFLVAVGMQVRLPPHTLYVAATLFHRFYVRFSLKRHHHYDVAATCIFLASKVEETGRKIKDLVVACCRVAQKNDTLVVDEQTKEYWRWRDIILFTEELLLEATCFDLTVRSPYSPLVFLTRRLVPDESKRNALSKSAWAFINDSVRTELCLRFSSNLIAAAAFYFASRVCHVDIGSEWWSDLDLSIDNIKDACNIMADLYEPADKLGEQKYTRLTN